jgi:hypothetical protein
LIAGCVRQHLKKDLSLTVQKISMIIEIKYPGVTPMYGKLWRGRERAIEQLCTAAPQFLFSPDCKSSYK